MATYYAFHNAGGGGVGTFGDPFTLQELFDNTDAGDLGLVCNTGTYTPSTTITVDNASAATAANPAIIRGANADGSDDGTIATISGSSLGASTDLLNMGVASLSIRLENLRITGATDDNIVISGSINNGNISLYNCRIDSATGEGIEMQETSYCVVVIVGCEIDGNGGNGITPNAATRYTPILINCKVHDNTANGMVIGGGALLPSPTKIVGCSFYDNGDNGIETISAVPGIIVVNSVFFGNTNAGIEILNTLYGFVSVNNIFRSNGGYGINTNTGSSGQFAFCDYNCYHNNTSGALDISTPGSNNVTSDPTFTSEIDGSEDFSLQSGSPCIDAGFGYGGDWNIGVWQNAASGGGGGGLMTHPGMSGGING